MTIATITVDHALEYAARGLYVLPVWWTEDGRCACRDRQCERPAKHPIGRLAPHGQDDATIEHGTIRAWLARYPRANLGIALAPSGLIAFDVDTPPAHAAFAKLEAEYGPLAWRQRSGSGNLHAIAKKPAFPIRGALDGITLRGRNYVVAAPSIHSSGGRYAWLPGHAPWDCEPSDLAPALAERMRVGSRSRSTSPRPTTSAKPGAFDIGSAMARSYPGVRAYEHQGRRCWEIECPWIAAHTSGWSPRETVVSVDLTTGELGFKCQHSHCTDRHWIDFRQHLDPAWRPYVPRAKPLTSRPEPTPADLRVRQVLPCPILPFATTAEAIEFYESLDLDGGTDRG